MAQTHDYKLAFLPPEPWSQREAQRRPDARLWKQAENKEIETLWDMGTFELQDRDPTKLYDLLPLQFVYKLKIKDDDF